MSQLRVCGYSLVIAAILAHQFVYAGSAEDDVIEIGWAQIMAGRYY